MGEQDLVSCLMLSLPVADRFELMKRSVGHYLRQTHQHRELVVVVDHGPSRDAYLAYFERLQRSDVRLVVPAKKIAMPDLRNLSLDEAHGGIVCQWDDDDAHHPQRIEAQLALLRSDDADAVYLEDSCLYFSSKRELYWTNWRKTPSGGHQGTLLCRRDVGVRYSGEGADYSLVGEDELFRQKLSQSHKVSYLRGQAQLYTYIIHDRNLTPHEHHLLLAGELAISKGLTLRHRDVIVEAWRVMGMDVPVNVMSRDGLAFSF